MDSVRNTFESELDAIRTQNRLDASSVSLLVDALHAGVDIFDRDTELKAQKKWLAECN